MNIIIYNNSSISRTVDLDAFAYAIPINSIENIHFKNINNHDLNNNNKKIGLWNVFSEKNVLKDIDPKQLLSPFNYSEYFNQLYFDIPTLDQPLVKKNGLNRPTKTTIFAARSFEEISKPAAINALFKKLYLEGKFGLFSKPNEFYDHFSGLEQFNAIFPEITASCLDEKCLTRILILSNNIQRALKSEGMSLKKFSHIVNSEGQHRMIHEFAKQIGNDDLAMDMFWLNRQYKPSMDEFKRLDKKKKKA